MMRLSGALAVAAVASGPHTSLSSTVCMQLLAPPPSPSEEAHEHEEHVHDHEHVEVAEVTEASRCAAAGVSGPDCAFFHEVLSLHHEMPQPEFCETVQAVADCAHLLGHVLTSSTVQDLVEAECLKRSDDHAYCNELKVSVGGNDQNENAKGLWQCYKAHEAAVAEKAHRAHAESHSETVEELVEEEAQADEPAPRDGHGEMVVALGLVTVIGVLMGAYLKTRPRIVSLDDALMSNEGYSQVLDAYDRAHA